MDILAFSWPLYKTKEGVGHPARHRRALRRVGGDEDLGRAGAATAPKASYAGAEAQTQAPAIGFRVISSRSKT